MLLSLRLSPGISVIGWEPALPDLPVHTLRNSVILWALSEEPWVFLHMSLQLLVQ